MWEELPEKDNQNHILRLLSELEIKVVGTNDLEKEIISIIENQGE